MFWSHQSLRMDSRTTLKDTDKHKIMKINLLHPFTSAILTLIFHHAISQDESLRPCFLPSGGASFCVPSDRCRHIKTLVRVDKLKIFPFFPVPYSFLLKMEIHFLTNLQLSSLQKPLPGDISLYIKDSFFCPRSPSGEARVRCTKNIWSQFEAFQL